jgi:hypothetical protein
MAEGAFQDGRMVDCKRSAAPPEAWDRAGARRTQAKKFKPVLVVELPSPK